MALFISRRAKFLTRFERSLDGFTYRETPWSRAIAVSDAERDWLISEFDRADAQTGPVVFTAFILATAVSICLWQVPSTHAYGGAVFWLAVLGVCLGCGLYFDRRAKSFKRSRPFVDDGLCKADADRRERRNTSWAFLLAMVLFGAFSFRDALRADDRLARLSLFLLCGMLMANFLWVSFQKLRDRRRDQQISKS